MKKYTFVFLLFFVLLVTVGCTANEQSAEINLPGVDVPSNRINTMLELTDDPAAMNSLKNSDILSLRLVNISDATITFPGDYGVMLFVWNGTDWTDKVENISFATNTPQSLLPKKQYPTGDLVSVIPTIDESLLPATLRVVVVGHVQDNESEKVAAYVDVQIIP